MSKKRIVGLIFAAWLAGLAGAWLVTFGANKSVTTARENAYDRVMRTQTLRCGYVVWTPFLMKDPNTARFSGLFYDYVEALGNALKLKVEWTEEESWAEFPVALESGRIDAMCGGSWPNSGRARQIDFVRPILYQPTYAYVRAGDSRFDGNPDAINDPAVTLAFVEGTSQAVIAASDFPKAKIFALPALTDLSDVFVNLVAGKADVGLANMEAAHQYDVNNPGQIRRVEAKAPLRVFGNGIAIAGGEDRLRRMLDISTEELISSGQVEKIIAKYDHVPGSMLRVMPPYQNEGATQ